MLRLVLTVVYSLVVRPWHALKRRFGARSGAQGSAPAGPKATPRGPSRPAPSRGPTAMPAPDAEALAAMDPVERELAQARRRHGDYPIPLSVAIAGIVQRLVDCGDWARAEALLGEIPEPDQRSRMALALAKAHWRRSGTADSRDCERLIDQAERDSRGLANDDWSERRIFDRNDCLGEIAALYGAMGRCDEALQAAAQSPDPKQRIWALGRLQREHLRPAGQGPGCAVMARIEAVLLASGAEIQSWRDPVEKAGPLKALVEGLADLGAFDKAAEVAATIATDSLRFLATEHLVKALRRAGQERRAQEVAQAITSEVIRRRALEESVEERGDDSAPAGAPRQAPEASAAPAPRPATAPGARAAGPSPSGKTYSVMVIDNFNRHDPDERFTITGFTSPQAAEAYAVARVRASIEHCRAEAEGKTPEELRRRWETFGEEVVVEGRYIGLSRFEEFAAQPATATERDYLALKPT